MLFLLGKTQRGESQPFTDSSRLRTPAGRRLLQMGALSPSIHSLIHSFIRYGHIYRGLDHVLEIGLWEDGSV